MKTESSLKLDVNYYGTLSFHKNDMLLLYNNNLQNQA